MTAKNQETAVSLLVVGLLVGCGTQRPVGGGATAPSLDASIEISPGDAEVKDGPGEWFSGQAWVQMRYAATNERQFSVATVTFAPGTRTAWHVHPAGQTLIVTSGTGPVTDAQYRAGVSGGSQ